MTDMTAWLGPAAEQMTKDQITRFAAIWHDIENRYPDDPDLQSDVLTAAAQYILEDTNLEDAAARLGKARANLHSAMETGKQIALMAIDDGMEEQAAAKALGVTRKTLRRAAGKE